LTGVRCPTFDCRQHVISAVQRFFPVLVASIFVLYLFCFTIFVRESRNQYPAVLCDVHQTNRAVPQFRIRNDIRNQMFRKSVAACADKVRSLPLLSPDISLITIAKYIDLCIQNQMPHFFMRLSEIFWIVGSSPTMTKKHDRFKLLLESIIAGLSFPT